MNKTEKIVETKILLTYQNLEKSTFTQYAVIEIGDNGGGNIYSIGSKNNEFLNLTIEQILKLHGILKTFSSYKDGKEFGLKVAYLSDELFDNISKML